MKITHEVVNGIPLTRIGDDTYHYSFGYYATNNWLDEHRLVLYRNNVVGYEHDFYANYEAVLVDIEAETETVLGCFAPQVVYGALIYATRKEGDTYVLFCRNTADDTETELYRHEHRMSDFTITADGKYLVFALYPQEEKDATCVRLNLTDGTVTPLFSKKFQKPFSVANHFMVNPQNHTQVFFAHEGDTFYVSNRLWLHDPEKGTHCMARQRLDDEGNLGDCFGHECWSPDGSGLWFVKYPCSPLPPRGLCFVGVDGKQTDVVYGGYPYWHVCCAPNNRYLAADTQSGDYSAVVLIDKESGKETEINRSGYLWKHPAHPHPTFSPSSEQVLFTDLKDGQLTLGIVRTADVF